MHLPGSDPALTVYCDGMRHLVCMPYTIPNLHTMAALLGIKRCWYHPSKGGHEHYDIPKRRIEEVQSKCTVVEGRDVIAIMKGTYRPPR